MNDILKYILKYIEQENPLHGKKLKKNLENQDKLFYTRAEAFLKKYISFLAERNQTLDYGIECYLKMIADVTYEQLRFFQTDEYSGKSFEEVNQRVYNNPLVMDYYMNGLILSQFLWTHHYEIYTFFIEELPKYREIVNKYLEIGAGHGLYLSEAINCFDKETIFDVADISESSINMTQKFINKDNINFNLCDIFNFNPTHKYDFITMGEVLEHVEDPVKLLSRLKYLLDDNGHIFITVPANAPAIDHIYLFRNAEEIRKVIENAGLKVKEERSFYAENTSKEKAEKFKVSLMYGAFLQKKN